MRILFCTDGSDISVNAFNNASKYIEKAIVDPICIIDWSFLPASMNIDTATYSKAYENIADSVLNNSEDLIYEKNYTLGDKIKNFGSPLEGILEQLEKERYDMIIMGSHGKKGLQKWLGSVSRQVVSNTHVPVYISKKETTAKKVLVAVDGSESTLSSIKHAVKLLNLKDKEIFVVSVKESPEFFPMEANLDKNWLDSIEKQQKVHATKAIHHAKTALEEHGVEIQNETILTGNAAQKIIEYADMEKIDLIIMGARIRAELSKLLLGSVSKRVLENTMSDVLIVSK